MRKFLLSRAAKVLVFLVCSVPAIAIVVKVVAGVPNAVETIQLGTGDWTLRFLVITLAITPLRKALRVPELIRFRRMFGLFAFAYLCLHFLAYLGPDQSFSLSAMLKDVVKRPFILVGFLAFLLMIPLAVTSTQGMIRRLGGRRWQQLHRAIYLIAILGVIHYYWKVKSDTRDPIFYGVLVAVLLLYRLVDWLLKKRQANLAAPRVTQPSLNS